MTDSVIRKMDFRGHVFLYSQRKLQLNEAKLAYDAPCILSGENSSISEPSSDRTEFLPCCIFHPPVRKFTTFANQLGACVYHHLRYVTLVYATQSTQIRCFPVLLCEDCCLGQLLFPYLVLVPLSVAALSLICAFAFR